jgi:hypothetical protein
LWVTGGRFLSMISAAAQSRWQPSWIWFLSIIWRTPQSCWSTGPIFLGWGVMLALRCYFFHWVQLSRKLPNTTQRWSVDMLLQMPDNGDETWRNIDNAGIADMNNHEVTSG